MPRHDAAAACSQSLARSVLCLLKNSASVYDSLEAKEQDSVVAVLDFLVSSGLLKSQDAAAAFSRVMGAQINTRAFRKMAYRAAGRREKRSLARQKFFAVITKIESCLDHD
jgi:hypothetical protein